MKLHVFALTLALALFAHATKASGTAVCEIEAASGPARIVVSLLAQSLDDAPAVRPYIQQLAESEEWTNPLIAAGKALNNVFHKAGVSRAMHLTPENERPLVRRALLGMLIKKSGQAQDVALAKENTQQVIAPKITDLLDPGQPGLYQVAQIRLAKFQDRPVLLGSFVDVKAGGRHSRFMAKTLFLFDPFNPDVVRRKIKVADLPYNDKNHLMLFERSGKSYVGSFPTDKVFEVETKKYKSLNSIGLGNVHLHMRLFDNWLIGVDDFQVGSKHFVVGHNSQNGTRGFDITSHEPKMELTISGEIAHTSIKRILNKDFLVAQSTSISPKVLIRDMTAQTEDYQFVSKDSTSRLNESFLFEDEGRMYLALSEYRLHSDTFINRVDVLTGKESAIKVAQGVPKKMLLFNKGGVPHAFIRVKIGNGNEEYLHEVNLRTMQNTLIARVDHFAQYFVWKENIYAALSEETGAYILELSTMHKVGQLRSGPQNVDYAIPVDYNGQTYLFVVFNDELPVLVQLTKDSP